MRHIIIKTILLLLSVGFITSGYVTLFYTFTPLPGVNIENVATKQSIVLTDRNDIFLFDYSVNEQRTFVPYEEISQNIINATTAIEDHLFFEHNGIRLDSFMRALINNIRTLSFSQGGSTITQQVIKNVFLTTEKKIERKMKEFLLAIKLEKRLTKEEILELYLNTISYGGVSYGIAEASDSFYGKKPSELTIAESAYLAAIPKAPTYFSPYGRNRQALEMRKNQVLQLMLNHELITREEYQEARREEVYFQNQSSFSVRAPHFVFFVKEQLEEEHGAGLKALEGQRIRTTIDIEMQEEIEEMMQTFAPKLEKRFGAKNIASVVLSAETGEILSMVGSRDFFDGDIDGKVNIITSLRQPGSTFKPIAYSVAFGKGLTPDTIVYDVPTQFTVFCKKDRFESTRGGCYSPVNYTGKFVGPISLRNALAQSINVPAVKVLYIAGIAEVVALAQKMGITSLTKGPYHYGLSLVLGGAEVTPLELAQAYGVFANEGNFIPYTWKPNTEKKIGKRVIKKHITQEITSILSDDDARAPIFGRNTALNITKPPVAVKTGTTNNSRDIWIVGYSPDIITLVWAGNADSTPLENDATGYYLAPLFKDIITTVTKKYGKQGTYFIKNTVPPESGPEILFGRIDTEDPHTILHYIRRNRPTQRIGDPTEEPQYEHWEYSVREWIEKNEVVENQNQKTDPPIQNFSIESPKSKINRDAITTIIATSIPILNTQYEFYVNNTLIGSSHLPTISFNPKDMLKKSEEEVTVRVIANTDQGTYIAEEIYTIK